MDTGDRVKILVDYEQNLDVEGNKLQVVQYTQFKVPEILKVDLISRHGNTMEIAALFRGSEKLKDALQKMQNLLYSS